MGQSVEDGLGAIRPRRAQRRKRWSALRIAGVVAPPELRRSWHTLAMLGALTAIWLAGFMTAAQGARRTSSALDRFMQRTVASDASFTISDDRDGRQLLQAVRAQHGVGEADSLWFAATGLADEGGPTTALVAPTVGHWGTAFDRPIVIDGRAPDPSSAAEVALTAPAAAAIDARVGETITIPTWDRDEWYAWLEVRGAYPPFRGPAIEVRVVGIVRIAIELAGGDVTGRFVVATPAFFERWGGKVGDNERLIVAALDGGIDPLAMARAVSAQLGRTVAVETATDAYGDPMKDATGAASIALWVLVIAIGLAGLLLVSLGLSREVRRLAVRLQPLGQLGASSFQTTFVSLVPAALVAATGLVAAASVAWMLSSNFPSGTARRLDPTAGDSLDWLAMLIGSAAIAAAIMIAAGGLRKGSGVPRLTSPVRPVGRAGVGGAIGRRRARRRSGRTVAGAMAMLIAGAMAAMWFSASLDHVEGDRSQWGYTWSAMPDLGFDSERFSAAVDATLADHDVASVGELRWGTAFVDGRSLQLTALNTFGGDALTPRLITGALPGPGFEIAFGPITASELDVGLGDVVEIESEDARRAGFRVVGIVVPPPVGESGVPGAGAYLSGDGLARVFDNGGPGSTPVMSYRAGAAQSEVERRLSEQVGWVFPPAGHANPPPAVRNVLDVGPTVDWLAAFFLVAALAGAVIAGERRDGRRTSEVAVLRALGFTDSDVRRSAIAESAAITVWALALGMPIGTWIGVHTWRRSIRHLGIGDGQPTPIAAGAITVTLAAVAALVFGWLLTRRSVGGSPADVLRAA